MKSPPICYLIFFPLFLPLFLFSIISMTHFSMPNSIPKSWLYIFIVYTRVSSSFIVIFFSFFAFKILLYYFFFILPWILEAAAISLFFLPSLRHRIISSTQILNKASPLSPSFLDTYSLCHVWMYRLVHKHQFSCPLVNITEFPSPFYELSKVFYLAGVVLSFDEISSAEIGFEISCSFEVAFS